MAIRVNGELVTVASGGAIDDASADSFEVEGEATAELRLTELDQADPAGRFRILVSGDAITIERAASAGWASSTVLWSASAVGFLVPDDELLRWGTDGDIATVNRSSTLNANTVLTNVLIGTPVSAATPANSLLLSNVTADGDIALFTVNSAGANSIEMMRFDASAALVVINEASSDIDFRVESDGNANMLVVDGGLNAVGIGGAAAANQLLTITTTGTTATSLLVASNTSNDAAANDAAIVISVGGTTSTGDPKIVWTIPGAVTINGGASWSMGPDNSNNADSLIIAASADIGSGQFFQIDATTSTSNASRNRFRFIPAAFARGNTNTIVRAIQVDAWTITQTGTSQVTSSQDNVNIGQVTFAQSGGAVTIDRAANLAVIPAVTGASVTLTANIGILVQSSGAQSGTVTAQHGIYIQDLTSGSADYGLTIEGADTACIWISSAADTTDAANGIAFGSSKDTNLYRSAANVLQTDDSLSGLAGVYVGSSGSTNNLIDDASNGAGTTTLYIGNAAITVVSDMRLKMGVRDTQVKAVDLINRFRVVDFMWNDPTDTARVNRNSRGMWVGMIGQEMVNVAPWIVNAPDQTCVTCLSGQPCARHPSYWHVEYEHLVPTLVKGIQELDDADDELGMRIRKLEDEIAELKARRI